MNSFMTQLHYTRKIVPITRRASSFLVFFCRYVIRKEEDEGETEQLQ